MTIEVGQQVTRNLAGTKMRLKVSEIANGFIYCGPWKFDAVTGAEIDEELGWDNDITGSYLEELFTPPALQGLLYCDTEGCGYQTDTLANMADHLYDRCPECGAPLLSEQDRVAIIKLDMLQTAGIPIQRDGQNDAILDSNGGDPIVIMKEDYHGNA